MTLEPPTVELRTVEWLPTGSGRIHRWASGTPAGGLQRRPSEVTGRPPGSRSLWRSAVARLDRLRSLPVRAVTRVQSGAAASDAGMTTAEYAVGTVAACGFGGILYKIITSDQILGLLSDVIARAFKLAF